jgi:hypothetical protein
MERLIVVLILALGLPAAVDAAGGPSARLVAELAADGGPRPGYPARGAA